MNPEHEATVDAFGFDQEEERIQDANDVINDIMSGRNTMEDMQTIGKPVLQELVLHLYKAKDKSALANLSLIAIAEHMGLTNMLAKNLVEATLLLKKHNIPFQSMVNVDAAEADFNE